MSRLRRPLSALVLALVVLGLVTPAAALAQATPFAPIPQAAPEPAPVQTVASTSTSNGELSTTDEILLFGGGVVVLTLIIYAIWRDAKRRAPLAKNETPYDDDSIKTPHPKKRQQRAKDKRAREARKRNRKK